MKLKSLNRYISLFVLTIFFLPLHAEDEIDIWNKEKKITEDPGKYFWLHDRWK